jgi:hypothetical protein
MSSYIKPFVPDAKTAMNMVFSFSDVVIDKVKLQWLDFERLAKDFPSRVQILANEVRLIGPVRICPPETPAALLKSRFFGSLGVAVPIGIVSFRILMERERKRFHTTLLRTIHSSNNTEPNSIRSVVMSVLLGLAAGAITFLFLHNRPPLNPYLHFFQRPIITIN